MNNKSSDFNFLRRDVIDNDLCVRCGLCRGVCPVDAISLDGNSYPFLSGKCTRCGFCVSCCPGKDVDFPALLDRIFHDEYSVHNLIGHVEKMHICRARNERVVGRGASGSAVTGLLVYLLEKGEIDGAVVIGMSEEKPYRSKGFLATTPEEIIGAASSKYCITPSMEALHQIRKREGRFAVVGLPCQIQGLRKMEKVDPALSKKIAFYFGLFCNCNIEFSGITDAIEANGVALDQVAGFQFRGGGWPGAFHVSRRDGQEMLLHPLEMKNSVLNVMFRMYGARRCFYCLDAVSEYSDLSFGDFWAHDYREDLYDYEGCSMVYQRTERGRRLLQEAQRDGAVFLKELPPERNSKRILKMTKGKKSRALARLYKRKKKHLPIPEYHIPIERPNSAARQATLLYGIFQLFRRLHCEKMVLRLLFSPFGRWLDRCNTIRKNKLSHYGGN